MNDEAKEQNVIFKIENYGDSMGRAIKKATEIGGDRVEYSGIGQVQTMIADPNGQPRPGAVVPVEFPIKGDEKISIEQAFDRWDKDFESFVEEQRKAQREEQQKRSNIVVANKMPINNLK